MTCVHIGDGIMCFRRIYRMRLDDGRHVWMEWHSFFGPSVYRDRDCNREIVNWYDDLMICAAIQWFIDRGEVA